MVKPNLAMSNKTLAPYKPENHIRIVTAASLFDGHDAAINIMRRIIQSTGVEVIHLGHDRSVQEIVNCAIQEDVHFIGLSILSGAHTHIFPRVIDLLKDRGAEDIKIIAGGIIPDEEIPKWNDMGIEAIFGPGSSTKDIIKYINGKNIE